MSAVYYNFHVPQHVSVKISQKVADRARWMSNSFRDNLDSEEQWLTIALAMLMLRQHAKNSEEIEIDETAEAA